MFNIGCVTCRYRTSDRRF